MGLAKDLKVGTKRSHTAAENTKFVASFLRGVVDEDSYKTLMRDFYFVYSAIEEEKQRCRDGLTIHFLLLSTSHRWIGLSHLRKTDGTITVPIGTRLSIHLKPAYSMLRGYMWLQIVINPTY